MLHRNMNKQLSPALHRDLEYVLGSLQHARRTGDLGRLALSDLLGRAQVGVRLRTVRRRPS